METACFRPGTGTFRLMETGGSRSGTGTFRFMETGYPNSGTRGIGTCPHNLCREKTSAGCSQFICPRRFNRRETSKTPPQPGGNPREC
jgi:hypothetical protein